MLLRALGGSVGGTSEGLSVRRPCTKVYRACLVGNDASRCSPGLQEQQLSIAAGHNTQLDNCVKL